jgi:hypothetical protein
MPSRKVPPTPETPISQLWNMSDITAEWLEELGINNYQALVNADLYHLWSELKIRHRQVTRLMFYGLWGAVNNCHWKEIPEHEVAAFEEYRSKL